MTRTIALMTISGLAVAACGGGDGGAGTASVGLDAFGDGTWQLVSGDVDGAALALVDGSPVTILLSDGQVGGTSGCNQYFGTAIADGATLTIGTLGGTEMACVDEGVMSLEAAYLGALARVTAAERVGDELVLAGGGVELRLAAVPVVPDAELEGTTWVLESLIAGDTVSSTVAGSRATLTIAGGTGSGSTGCNTFNGPMEPGEDVITSGDLATTRMACDGLMEQEEAVLAVLGASPAHVIEGDTLTLTLEDGRALVYRAEG